MKRSLLYLMALICLEASPNRAQSWTFALDSALTYLASQEMFNGQLLLAEDGQIVFHEAYGIHQGIKVSCSTPLPIASIDKPITAIGLMILADQDRINIDDRAIRYIPALPYPDVTIRQLMNQTSGIPNFLATAIAYGDTTRIIRTDEILDLIAKLKPHAGKAGERFAYNNSNYLLCRRIIEEVSGMPFAVFMRQSIGIPLDMTNTRFDNLAEVPETDQIHSGNFYNPGQGIYSTVEDLFRLAVALQSDDFLRHETVEDAFSHANLNDGSRSEYGLGWYVLETPEGKSIGHWGGGEGVKAYLEMYLSEEKMLVMLTVNSTQYIDPVYQMIRDIWDQKPFEVPSKREIYEIDVELYKEYVGSYLSPGMGLLHVSADDGKLYLRPDPIPGKEELVPSSDSTFYFRNQDLDWQFYRDSVGNVVGFGFTGDREKMGVKQ